MDNQKENRRLKLKEARQSFLDDVVKHPVFYGLEASFKSTAIINNRRYKRILKDAGDIFDKTSKTHPISTPLEIRGMSAKILRHRMRYLMN